MNEASDPNDQKSRVVEELETIRKQGVAKNQRGKFKNVGSFLTPEQAQAYLAQLQIEKKTKVNPIPPTNLPSAELTDWYSRQRKFDLEERKKREEAENFLRGYRSTLDHVNEKSKSPQRKKNTNRVYVEVAENSIDNVLLEVGKIEKEVAKTLLPKVNENDSQNTKSESDSISHYTDNINETEKAVNGTDIEDRNEGTSSTEEPNTLDTPEQSISEEGNTGTMGEDNDVEEKEKEVPKEIDSQETEKEEISSHIEPKENKEEERVSEINEDTVIAVVVENEEEEDTKKHDVVENEEEEDTDIAVVVENEEKEKEEIIVVGNDEAVEEEAQIEVIDSEEEKEETVAKEIDVGGDNDEETRSMAAEDEEAKNNNVGILENMDEVEEDEIVHGIIDNEKQLRNKVEEGDAIILEVLDVEVENEELMSSDLLIENESYSEDKIGKADSEEESWRDMISGEPGARFPPEPNRYHLYVSHACPWAHRTVMVMVLKGLEDVIGVTFVHPTWQYTKPGVDEHRGWVFGSKDGKPFCSTSGVGSFPSFWGEEDPNMEAKSIRDIYELVDDTTERYILPLLWDKELKTIVSNESSEIIRMLNLEFNEYATNPTLDLYPESMSEKVDEVNKWIYPSFNNGVYRCGLASTQESYDVAIDELTAAFDKIDSILQKQRYIAGGVFTEADVRLFVTLIRFDEVYDIYFKTNTRSVSSTPAVLNYVREIYQMKGVADTCAMDMIKAHYYTSHVELNKYSIIPRGVNFIGLLQEPHNRDTYFSTPR